MDCTVIVISTEDISRYPALEMFRIPIPDTEDGFISGWVSVEEKDGKRTIYTNCGLDDNTELQQLLIDAVDEWKRETSMCIL